MIKYYCDKCGKEVFTDKQMGDSITIFEIKQALEWGCSDCILKTFKEKAEEQKEI